MAKKLPQSNMEKVQQLKLDPELNDIHDQVILKLMEQVLQVNPEEPFQVMGAAFESRDYGYFKLSFRKDTGDSEEESALWVDFVRVRHDPEFKAHLYKVMQRVGAPLPDKL